MYKKFCDICEQPAVEQATAERYQQVGSKKLVTYVACYFDDSPGSKADLCESCFRKLVGQLNEFVQQ